MGHVPVFVHPTLAHDLVRYYGPKGHATNTPPNVDPADVPRGSGAFTFLHNNKMNAVTAGDPIPSGAQQVQFHPHVQPPDATDKDPGKEGGSTPGGGGVDFPGGSVGSPGGVTTGGIENPTGGTTGGITNAGNQTEGSSNIPSETETGHDTPPQDYGPSIEINPGDTGDTGAAEDFSPPASGLPPPDELIDSGSGSPDEMVRQPEENG